VSFVPFVVKVLSILTFVVKSFHYNRTFVSFGTLAENRIDQAQSNGKASGHFSGQILFDKL